MPVEMLRIMQNAKGFKVYAPGGPAISKTFSVRSGVGGDEEESLFKPTNMLGATSEVIRIMRDYLRQIRVKDAGKKERTTLREIEELHEQEFRERQDRHCMSERDIGEEDEIRV